MNTMSDEERIEAKMRGFPRTPHGIPEASPLGAELKRVRERLDDANDHDRALTQQQGEWLNQRRDYERVIADATPDGDMREVAAARAGIEVLDCALKRLSARVRTAGDDKYIAEQAFGEVWGKYVELRTGVESSYRGGVGPSSAELARLLSMITPREA